MLATTSSCQSVLPSMRRLMYAPGVRSMSHARRAVQSKRRTFATVAEVSLTLRSHISRRSPFATSGRFPYPYHRLQQVSRRGHHGREREDCRGSCERLHGSWLHISQQPWHTSRDGPRRVPKGACIPLTTDLQGSRLWPPRRRARSSSSFQ